MALIALNHIFNFLFSLFPAAKSCQLQATLDVLNIVTVVT